MAHLPFPALACKNCSQPIPLPLATHPDMFQGHGSWPKGVEKRNFLCTLCRHAYEYSAVDVQMFLAQKDPRKEGKPYNVVSMWLPCGVGGCASLLEIRIVVAFDKDLRERALEILPKAQVHAIRCNKGHTLNGQLMPFGMAFDVVFDEDWVTSEYP